MNLEVALPDFVAQNNEHIRGPVCKLETFQLTEEADTKKDLTNSSGEAFARICSFGGCEAYEFSAGEGESGDDKH